MLPTDVQSLVLYALYIETFLLCNCTAILCIDLGPDVVRYVHVLLRLGAVRLFFIYLSFLFRLGYIKV